MATSSYPIFGSQNPRTQVALHAGLKMGQTMGMIVPPIYLLTLAVRKRPFSIRRLMNVTTTWVGIGSIGLGGLGWARMGSQSEEAIFDRCERLKYNQGQLRCDDYSIIGASLGAIVTPAILLRRAPLPTLVFGGASLGLGMGTLTHIIKSFTEGEDVRPEGMVRSPFPRPA
ncbi:hypothetical protein TREMEDRAFT_28036 [Tremella mesenterica DSM 1558]|uniref:uncharacterized protein n=1 Tax=Tremella mesenterica (strain ATCC 24925 / CBS 8224 / DSM 1558 / NBRC 9311 / NRRL Y-6157 / RJB 2259-6 / UBC 559-6) TaxID=578456 RepID=UPI0003F4912E|nr:uncharacterized protein TREMEDRAFT_28036 [Tremella mesenterica DSM 1558]EIW71364.1 hypothetical protein TREMEDRAFT_28036 [Tremella mesenterica DSM 1558]